MQRSLGLLFALAFGGEVAAGEKPTAVLPAVVYRDHVFTHYREPTSRGKPYVISVRPLGNHGIRTSVEVSNGAGPRNDFESVFVRVRVLVVGVNTFEPSRKLADGPSRSTDTVEYVSAARLCDAKWVNVEPGGEPVKSDGAEDNPRATMWGRRADLPTPFADFAPGATEILHTAVAAAGGRDLLVFDLVRTAPARGKMAPPPKVAVTRVVPEAGARVGAFGIANWGRPEVKAVGEVPAAFAEPFQAYSIGDDYYFLTKSGSVYRSPPPEQGKPRAMTAVWDETRPRVQFILSDGHKAGVHVLVTARGKGGWDYFRLGPDPRPQPLTVDTPREEGAPAEVAYDLARLLRETKEIATPK
jgi:hypothetical protein